MKLSKKLRFALLLALVFSISFAVCYVAIFLTQSAYSTPSSAIMPIEGMDITFGPSPNSTNVPLNTAITVDAMASIALNDLHLTPEVPIARVNSEDTSSIDYLNTFYPAELLQPATTYNVSVTIRDKPVSWTFTTTAEPFHPEISYYLATNVLWISLGVAGLITVTVGYVIWFRFRQVLEDWKQLFS